MKVVVLLLSIATLFAGSVSAWLWFRASRVAVVPLWARGPAPFEPVEHRQSQDGWIVGILEATSEAARLNKYAAGWSGATTFLGGMTTFVGTFLA